MFGGRLTLKMGRPLQQVQIRFAAPKWKKLAQDHVAVQLCHHTLPCAMLCSCLSVYLTARARRIDIYRVSCSSLWGQSKHARSNLQLIRVPRIISGRLVKPWLRQVEPAASQLARVHAAQSKSSVPKSIIPEIPQTRTVTGTETPAILQFL